MHPKVRFKPLPFSNKYVYIFFFSFHIFLLDCMVGPPALHRREGSLPFQLRNQRNINFGQCGVVVDWGGGTKLRRAGSQVDRHLEHRQRRCQLLLDRHPEGLLRARHASHTTVWTRFNRRCNFILHVFNSNLKKA